MSAPRTRALASFLTIACLIVAGGVALAGHRRGGPDAEPGGPGAHLGRGLHRLLNDPSVRERLRLGEEQIARLREIATEGRKELAGLRTELRSLRTELHERIRDPRTTRADLEAKHRDVARALEAVRSAAVRALLDARDVLDADQRQILIDLRGERRSGARSRGPGANRRWSPGRHGPRPDDEEGGAPPRPVPDEGPDVEELDEPE